MNIRCQAAQRVSVNKPSSGFSMPDSVWQPKESLKFNWKDFNENCGQLFYFVAKRPLCSQIPFLDHRSIHKYSSAFTNTSL